MSNKNVGSNTRDVNAAIRAQNAIKLYTEENLSWDDIAARAGYASRGAAHNAVMRELDRCVTHNVEELRRKQFYMLSTIQARCYKASNDKSNKDWLWAADRFGVLSERISKLMGLDLSAKEAAIGNVVVIREVPQGLLVEGKE